MDKSDLSAVSFRQLLSSSCDENIDKADVRFHTIIWMKQKQIMMLQKAESMVFFIQH